MVEVSKHMKGWFTIYVILFFNGPAGIKCLYIKEQNDNKYILGLIFYHLAAELYNCI